MALSLGAGLRETAGVGALVWVDGWQLDCCGDPFGIGDAVTWLLKPATTSWFVEMLGEEIGSRVSHAEERHDESAIATEQRGRVVSMRRVYLTMWRHTPQSVTWFPAEGSAELVDVVHTSDADSCAVPDGELFGYLVELSLWD